MHLSGSDDVGWSGVLAGTALAVPPHWRQLDAEVRERLDEISLLVADIGVPEDTSDEFTKAWGAGMVRFCDPEKSGVEEATFRWKLIAWIFDEELYWRRNGVPAGEAVARLTERFMTESLGLKKSEVVSAAVGECEDGEKEKAGANKSVKKKSRNKNNKKSGEKAPAGAR